MGLRLRADLHVVVCGRRTILLDARHDRYFRLADAADRAFQRALDTTICRGDDTALRPLIAAGLLVEDAAPVALVLPDPPRAPTEEIPASLQARPGEALQCALAQVIAPRTLRRRTLVQIGADLRERRARASFDEGEAAISKAARLAASFAQLHLLFPPLDRCLPRSLGFCMLALRRGIDAHLVFGIRANPFAAHCWAQRDEMVLNDSLERVRAFTPIMAL